MVVDGGGAPQRVQRSRRADLLDRALASVEKWLPDAPVHIWDNHSPDSPAVAGLASRRPHVGWTFSRSNVGYPAAMNQLMALVPDEDVLMLSPGCELLGPLTRAREVLAEPGVAVVAPTVPDLDGRDEPWDVARRPPTVLRGLAAVAGLDTTLRGRPPSDRYRRAPRGVEGSVTGGCLLVARSAWEDVGGFDDWFFVHGQDAAWQRAARARGWSLRLVADDEPQVRRGDAGPTDDAWAARDEDLRRAAQVLACWSSRGGSRWPTSAPTTRS